MNTITQAAQATLGNNRTVAKLFILGAIAAINLMAFSAAYAAPQEVVKLPRVTIIGKAANTTTTATREMQYLPRVTVYGKADTGVAVASQVVHVLPRVEIVGVSLATQLQRQQFAVTSKAAGGAI